MNFSNFGHSPVNWFDLIVVVVLLLGIRKGRMNGMSVELMPLLQWITIVAAGATLYIPLGDYLATTTPMSHLFCYIAVYLIIAGVTRTFFNIIKKSAGGKIVGSDLFGRAEFYLGMGAGALRYTCMLLAALALLNAPYYSTQEIASSHAFQMEWYGSNFFPELSSIQLGIFKDSLIGSLIKNHAEFILIKPTKAEPSKGLDRRKDDMP